MNEPSNLMWGLLVLGCAIVLRAISGQMDRERIREYLREEGGEALHIAWTPFGPGWFGSRSERIYEVTYRTPGGAVQKATCKTSLLSGVYWTQEGMPPLHAEVEERVSREPFSCFQCGATIPADSNRCSRCGWTYRDSPPSERNLDGPPRLL